MYNFGPMEQKRGVTMDGHEYCIIQNTCHQKCAGGRPPGAVGKREDVHTASYNNACQANTFTPYIPLIKGYECKISCNTLISKLNSATASRMVQCRCFQGKKENSLMPSKTHYLQLEHAAPQYLLRVESQFLRPIAGTYVVVGDKEDDYSGLLVLAFTQKTTAFGNDRWRRSDDSCTPLNCEPCYTAPSVLAMAGFRKVRDSVVSTRIFSSNKIEQILNGYVSMAVLWW
ncbi:hypothetical protein SFRURICE_005420 [Spodoptera frugiperda]|uniref:SFRICE_014953 n=1 Tax=Spodoptera frugiperda TaxID=7108 RepID=A0A2H1WZK5_SPOFR|nr:hypothetical protein SFRURICE_005420 [Spodoptera frugiperda]